MSQQQLHDFVAELMINQDGRKVQAWLPCLSFKAVDNDGVIGLQVFIDLFDCTESTQFYQHFIAMIKEFTTS